jgi:hypothetical protein
MFRPSNGKNIYMYFNIPRVSTNYSSREEKTTKNSYCGTKIEGILGIPFGT